MDHCVCIGANLVDIGALTNFTYLYQNREQIYDLLESCCGARLTVSYVRVGGLAIDVPDDFVPRSRRLLETIPEFLADVQKLVNGNRIVRNRLTGTGVVTSEQAVAWGLTGPMLRSSGVAYDVRRARPYDFYDKFDWDIPVSRDGDNFARYMVRMEEIRQSMKIIRQALDILPSSGPVNSDDWRVVLPPKDAVYHDMESLIYHFKLIMEASASRPASDTSGSRAATASSASMRCPTASAARTGLRCRGPASRTCRRTNGSSSAARCPTRSRRSERSTSSRESWTDERHRRRHGGIRGAADVPAEALRPGDSPRHGRHLRHFVRNIVNMKRLPTIEYPEERRNYSGRFRGKHILKTREDGTLKCVACYMCAQACPAECITIVAGEHPKIAYEKYPVVFDIDMMRCVFCGFCVDACPKDAIWMTRRYDMAFFTREDAVFSIDRLRETPEEIQKFGYGYRPYYPGDGTTPPTDARCFRSCRAAASATVSARRACRSRTAIPAPAR
jgi:NADH-quinone oxidoreductase chain I